MALLRRPTLPPLSKPVKLHIGCGENIYEGWINIDLDALKGVDYALDVRRGLPFENASVVYAEHFLEHMSLEAGMLFLKECRRVLASDGLLRVSTPNLDWVYLTHYRHGQWPQEEDARMDCMRMNRAFHGWGHQFLYNRPMLASVLEAAGFREVRFQRYGESDRPELRGLEKHETWEDRPDLPHVLIAEASGESAEDRPLSLELLREYRQAMLTR